MLASRILWYLDATGSMSPSDCINDAGSAPQLKSNFSSSMANTTSYNRNALLTLDTLTPSVLPQKMPMFQKWHCFGDVFVHVVSTQAAPKSLSRAGHFLGQVAVQNRPQRRLQDILAALRVRVTDFGPQSPQGIRVRVPHFSSTNAIKCPSKGRVLNPLAPVSFFVGTSEIRGYRNRPKCQKHDRSLT